MTNKNHEIGTAVSGRMARAAVFALTFVLAASAASSNRKTVTLHFSDSVMVNDTLIRIGDIAKVHCADHALAAQVKNLTVGEAAPAGFSRFVNSADLVIYRLRPQFKDIEFVKENQKRVKVTSDYREVTAGEFEEQIRNYVSKRLDWKAGEWSLTVNNLSSSWKIGKGELAVDVSGIENPYAKGNVNLTLVLRQGSKVSRMPVSCRIAVKAPVLVASRPIKCGEEFNEDNCKIKVMDITNFAYAPLTELPKAGSMTASRTVSAGNILHGNMLKAIPDVIRGDQVRIHFIGERVKISILGVARDSGANGDRIWVENLQTKKLIRASVNGKGSVVVHQEGEKS